MKAYFKAVRKWMLILFMLVLCTAMGKGGGFAIAQAIEGKSAWLLIFIVYPFLLPMIKITAEAICKKEEKPKRPIWFDISPPIPTPPSSGSSVFLSEIPCRNSCLKHSQVCRQVKEEGAAGEEG